MRRSLLALALLAGCSPDSKGSLELHVFNWGDYFAADTISNFEKETGCKVKVDEITSSEQLRSKLSRPPSGYDVAIVNDEILPGFIAQGLVEKLDLSKIPNLKNIQAKFRGLSFDPRNERSVPYMWGTTGLAYNKEKVTPAPDSWAALWDPKLAGKQTLLGDPREVFAAALWVTGGSPTALTPDAIDKAAAKLKELKPKAWTSTPKEQLGKGEALLSQSFNGDAVQAAKDGPVAFVIPKEGGTLWIDNLCIARGAKNVDLAHRFIDYILRPEVSAAITNEVFFAGPNEPAQKLVKKEVLENPMVYPSEADLKRCAFLAEPPADLKKKLLEAWAQVRGQ